MTRLPVLTHSHRVALLGGVSLIALQGMSACTTPTVAPITGYTPPISTPYAPAPPDGYVVQPQYLPPDGTATTLAIGEEDGGYGQPVDPGTVTTLALGEEDGGYGQPVDPGTATTLAIGEEDGGYGQPVDPGIVTTLALGEEDGSLVPYMPPAFDGTTQALGEEG